jgi:hypothetical protein
MSWAKTIIQKLQRFGAELYSSNGNYACLNSVCLQFMDEQADDVVEKNAIVIHRDVYERKPQQLLFRLKSILGLNLTTLYARDTEVVNISRIQAEKFIDANHLIGFGGGKTFLGLRDDTELVAVAVFSKILYMKYEDPPYYSVELERYCSLVDTTVVGGLDKMIKAYLKEHEVDDIVTYVDKEWMDTSRASVSGYGKLGFEVVGETEPLLLRLIKKIGKESWYGMSSPSPDMYRDPLRRGKIYPSTPLRMTRTFIM